MAEKKTKTVKIRWAKTRNLAKGSNPKVRVLVISFACLVKTKAKIKYIPKRIIIKTLIKIQIFKPPIKKLFINVFFL